MWEEIFNLAISNGLFAVLFLIMLVYVLKDSNTREKKYQNTIAKLSDAFSELTVLRVEVDDISTDVDEMRKDLNKVASNLSNKN